LDLTGARLLCLQLHRVGKTWAEDSKQNKNECSCDKDAMTAKVLTGHGLSLARTGMQLSQSQPDFAWGKGAGQSPLKMSLGVNSLEKYHPWG